MRLFTYFIILFFITFLLFMFFFRNQIDGYHNYKDCIDQGFSKEFCVQTPWSISTCLCENGQIGNYLPGFRGQCICGYV